MITVAIISNEYPINEKILGALGFADEILIILDSLEKVESKNKKIKVFNRKLENDFASQRNFAIEKSKGDWVLFVDSDEYVSKELAREILEVTKLSKYNGFYVPRIDVVFHQPLLNGETGNTKILRLARKRFGKFSRSVHETWKIKGLIGELQGPLYHIKDSMISEFIPRITKYGQLDSSSLSKEGKPFSLVRLLLNPIGKFCQNYFLRKGFLDGQVGIFQAYLMSVQSLSVRVFQWENKN